MKRLSLALLVLLFAVTGSVSVQAASVTFDFTMKLTSFEDPAGQPYPAVSQFLGLSLGDVARGRVCIDTDPDPIYYADGSRAWGPGNYIYEPDRESYFSLQIGSYGYHAVNSVYDEVRDGNFTINMLPAGTLTGWPSYVFADFVTVSLTAANSSSASLASFSDLAYIDPEDIAIRFRFGGLEEPLPGDPFVGLGEFYILGAGSLDKPDAAPVPEPATVLLLGGGLVGLMGFRRRGR